MLLSASRPSTIMAKLEQGRRNDGGQRARMASRHGTHGRTRAGLQNQFRLLVMPQFKMSNGTWKLSLVLLAFLALVEIGVLVGHSPNLLGPAESGSLHAQLHPVGILRFRRFVIDQFDGESPLSKAGAQIGDSIELDSASNLSGTTRAGETVGLTLFHGASSRHLSLRSAPYNAPSDGGFEWLGVVY